MISRTYLSLDDMSTIPFKRSSFAGKNVTGETLDRLLLLGDLCDRAWGSHVGQWVRLVIRLHRGACIPDHIGTALDDIEEQALQSLNI